MNGLPESQQHLELEELERGLEPEADSNQRSLEERDYSCELDRKDGRILTTTVALRWLYRAYLRPGNVS